MAVELKVSNLLADQFHSNIQHGAALIKEICYTLLLIERGKENL